MSHDTTGALALADVARASDLAGDLALALARARDFANALANDRDLAIDLDRDLDLANDLANDLDRDLDLANDRAIDLANARARARARALALANDLARALVNVLVNARARDRDLISAVEECCQAAERLVRILETAATPETAGRATGEPAGRPPGRTVRALAAAACRMLPPSARARYAQEYLAELYDLPRRHRIAHAVRILRTAPALRLGLRANPAGRKARP